MFSDFFCGLKKTKEHTSRMGGQVDGWTVGCVDGWMNVCVDM